MKKTKPKVYPEAVIQIESLSHDGRGIGHIDHKATFVEGALPNETVKCKLTKRHSRYNEGDTLEVLSSSSDRVNPDCNHASICGGCSLQHMDMNAQIQFKQNVLLEQLKHFGQVVPENLLPSLSDKTVGYRRKARLGVRYVRKKERLLIGFREKFSNYLADIQTCSVLHPAVGMKIEAISSLIASLSQFEHIPQIEVAVSDTEVALVLRHMTDLPPEDLEKITVFAKQHHFHIYLQPNPPKPVHKFWPNDQLERLSYALPEFNLEMSFHPQDFTQVNGEINKLMIHQALKLMDPQPSDNILDLFCGLGNFTLPMARHAKHVTGVEGSHEMVSRAQDNALHNQINNTEFHAANLMDTSLDQAWMHKKYDKILIDPPRSGAQEIIRHFPRFGAERIVYVSCNPATLARDIKELVHNQHYKLKSTGIINMFPHTSHIEVIALLEK